MRAARSLLLAVSVVLGAPGTARVAGAAAPDFAALDSSVVAEMKATATPGASIAVVLGDSVVFARGYGVASLETGEAVTPSTLFRVASTTKMLVAAALANLAGQGKLDFGAPISSYAPGLDPAIGRLTVHQLLCHTAGLSDESSYDGPHDEDVLGAFIRTWRADRFFTEPGDVYSYSNPGYALAGHVLAEAADTTFDAALASLLFRPLGMVRSTTLPTRAMTHPFAQAHDVGGSGAFVVRPYPDDARYRPNGGVFTSAEEFARFALAFVNEGRIDGAQALPQGAIALLSRTYGRRPGGDPADPAGIAYGLVERRVRGARIFQHGGTRLGSGSIVRMAPEQRFAVVILTNRTGSYLPQTVERITTLALPAAAVPAPVRKASPPKWSRNEQSALAGTWVNQEPDLAIELFLEEGALKARRPGDTRGDAAAVTKLGERRYSFGGQEIESIPGPDGRPRYLHLGGRALARRPAGE